jgi:hypothetical protein
MVVSAEIEGRNASSKSGGPYWSKGAQGSGAERAPRSALRLKTK